MEKSDPNAVAEYLYKNLDFTVEKKNIKSRIHSSTLALENIFMSNKVSSLRIDVCFITPIDDCVEYKMLGDFDISKLAFLTNEEIENIKSKLKAINKFYVEAPLTKDRVNYIKIKNYELNHFFLPQYIAISFPDMITEIIEKIKID